MLAIETVTPRAEAFAHDPEDLREIDATNWMPVQYLNYVLNMHSDLTVLRAILRCSRHRRRADMPALAARVALTPRRLRAALGRLERAGLLLLRGDEARLTLVGLAVAVASIDAGRKRRPAPALAA